MLGRKGGMSLAYIAYGLKGGGDQATKCLCNTKNIGNLGKLLGTRAPTTFWVCNWCLECLFSRINVTCTFFGGAGCQVLGDQGTPRPPTPIGPPWGKSWKPPPSISHWSPHIGPLSLPCVPPMTKSLLVTDTLTPKSIMFKHYIIRKGLFFLAEWSLV